MTLTTILLQAGANGSNGWMSIIMMVALVAIFSFYKIRPQQKRKKEIANSRQNRKKKNNFVTAGGIYGKIKEVHDNYFIIEIAENTRIRNAKESLYPSVEETPKQA